MTAETTTYSNDGMDCERVARDEIAEAYVVGRLSEGDRTAFEVHYFECGRCFEEVQLLEAMRRELEAARTGPEAKASRPSLAWAGAAGMAAVVLLAVAAAWWTRPRTSPGPAPATHAAAPPAVGTVPPHTVEVPAAAGPSLDQLARVEAPPYESVTLRGVTDEAASRFERGMRRYRRGDYRGAVALLESAAALDPGAPHVLFFLGISHLMLGEPEPAIERLQGALALGDSPYTEHAHWYLAKAYLRVHDVRAAGQQLHAVIALDGSRASDARQLAAALATLESRRH